MWFTNFRRRKTKIEKEIDSVLDLLRSYPPETEEYTRIVENVAKLYEARKISKSSGVSNDTWAIIFANFIYILFITKHEQVDIITSKAKNYLLRGGRV